MEITLLVTSQSIKKKNLHKRTYLIDDFVTYMKLCFTTNTKHLQAPVSLLSKFGVAQENLVNVSFPSGRASSDMLTFSILSSVAHNSG